MNVTTNYKLSEKDFLHFQLFYFSKSIDIAKERRTGLIRLTIFYSLLGLFLFFYDGFTIYYYLVVTIPILMLFPYLSKRRYEKQCLYNNRVVYKNGFDIEKELTFTNETFEMKQIGLKSSTNYSQISEISETEKHYFLHLENFSQAIIIPKEKIQNLPEVANAIKEIAEKFNIKYNVELNWNWK